MPVGWKREEQAPQCGQISAPLWRSGGGGLPLCGSSRHFEFPAPKGQVSNDVSTVS